MSISAFRLVSGMGVLAATANGMRRFFDTVKGTDPFSRHTAEQHRNHPFSGMHEPFIPSKEQQELVRKYFPDHYHLLPTSLAELKAKQAVKSYVKIRPLEECPGKHIALDTGTIVVGGPPALISSAHRRNVTYINSGEGGIYEGAAMHGEWDGWSEAPTSYTPLAFMVTQLFRLFFNYQSLRSAEKTGNFPWRSLDWIGWLKHPEHWGEGIRVACAFQKASQTVNTEEVAQRCLKNMQFYEGLNQELDGQLLLSERGSVIVARTKEELQSLQGMDKGLNKEGKSLHFLSREQMRSRYGFVPYGLAFAEKRHDAVISPHFMTLVAKRLEMLGGEVIRGTLTTIYVYKSKLGGIVEYETSVGKKYKSFSHLILSLGRQRFLDEEGNSLYDIISAGGVSALALIYVPKGHKIPAVTVCGGTNHVTKLSGPVLLTVEGEEQDAYFVKVTSSACVTPTVSEEEGADYDGVAATGALSAVRKTFGRHVDVLSVYGCKRQVNEYGQGHWLGLAQREKSTASFFKPRGHDLDRGTSLPRDSRGVFIQMGAGGGGLTQAPAQAP